MLADSPQVRPRRDGWTEEKAYAFLERLAECGSVRHAAEAVGMSHSSAYRLRHREPVFSEAWKRASRIAYATLRESAMERAINGRSVPIYDRGVVVGRRVVHDERLVIFLLKTRGARRFNDRSDLWLEDSAYDDKAASLHAGPTDLLAPAPAEGERLSAPEGRPLLKDTPEPTQKREGGTPPLVSPLSR